MSTLHLTGKKVLVMGLGLHGGGVDTARYLIRHGAQVVCTDLRSEEILQRSVDALRGLGIRFVLGKHDEKDFNEADIILKNPAVPSNSPLLAGRRNVETDISLFLKAVHSPLIAVTGSKGKSTVVSALHHILLQHNPATRIGGNITVSPLSFADQLTGSEPVILELSSWQLADLKSRSLLRPKISCITNLMRDHQNYYTSFADYENDKAVIFENSDSGDWCVFPDNEYGRKWAKISRGQVLLMGFHCEPVTNGSAHAWLDRDGRGWFRQDNQIEELLPKNLLVPGLPFRMNAMFAAVMARLWGCETSLIRSALADFHGLPYRMELFLESGGIRFIDDTTATIPDAAAASIEALSCPVILIAGGADKALDFEPFDKVAKIPKRILMLAGSATDTWLHRLKNLGAAVEGPFNSIAAAVNRASSIAENGDAVILSPGAASFGMFHHEFERGDAFKAACRELSL